MIRRNVQGKVCEALWAYVQIPMEDLTRAEIGTMIDNAIFDALWMHVVEQVKNGVKLNISNAIRTA